MKVLFVTPHIPHLYGGGLRMYYQLKYLSRNGIKPHLLCFSAQGEKISDDIKSFTEAVYTVPLKPNNLTKRLKKLMTLKAYDIDRNFLNLANSLLRNKTYDLIHIHKFQMAEYFLMQHHIPVIVDLWACGLSGALNEVLYEKNLFDKLIKLTRLPRFYLADRKYYRNFDYFFVVSNEAKSYILKRFPSKKVYVVPNGVELEMIKRSSNDHINYTLIFTGDMSFFQNVDTVIFFVNEIYPYIKAKIPQIRFYVVGKNPHKSILGLSQKDNSIIVTGYVENMWEYLSKASVFVAPIRTGAGIRNKILEALACGLVVVATKNAVEGISVEDQKNVIIAQRKDFADKVIEVLLDHNKRKRISENARKLVEENYRWDKIASDMVNYCNEILNEFYSKNR
ncbi:MAG: glycosyltransferase family 4 protein [Elusimicrobiota bacterium]